MKRIFFLLVMLLAIIPLTSGYSCPYITSASLQSPVDATITSADQRSVDYDIFIDMPPNNQSKCYVQLWNASNPAQTYPSAFNQVLVDDEVSTTVALTSPTSPLEGKFIWNIVCEDQNTGICQNRTHTANRTIIFDRTGPTVTVTDPANLVFKDARRTFNFTSSDVFDGASHSCDLYVDGSLANGSQVANGTTAYLEATAPRTGSLPWFVNCTDNYGNTGVSATTTYIHDPAAMSINLSKTPADGSTEYENKVVDFNVTPQDKYSATGLNCSLYIEGALSDSMTVNNNSQANLSHTFTADGNYGWNVGCVDPYGNEYNSTARTLTLAIGPSEPTLWNIPTIVNTLWTHFTGYVDKFANITITTQQVSSGATRINDTVATQGYPAQTNYNGSARVSKIFSSSNTSFNTNNTSFVNAGNITTESYIRFKNHNRSNFLHYDVTGVTAFPNFATINVTPAFEHNISVNELFYVYDREVPTGWFNGSIRLYSGNNDVAIVGERDLIQGDEKMFSIYVDDQAPSIEHNIMDVTQPQTNFTINLSDDTTLSVNNLTINVTNGSQNWTFATMNRSYTNFTYPNITCTGQSCTWYVNLTADVYNITLSATDDYSNTQTEIYENFTVKDTVSPISFIRHEDGVTTLNKKFNVTWNHSQDPFLDFYEVAVGTHPGQVNVVGWYEVPKTENETVVDHSNITYSSTYYVSVRPVDQTGLRGSSVSTNLIYTEDATVPARHELRLISQVGNWITSNSSVQAVWNFTDNETGVELYEYALGTTNYTVITGFDDTVSVTQTTNSTGEFLSGLTLLEDEEYYLSARAKNGYEFGVMRTQWASSTPVRVDSVPPVSALVSYNGGSLTVPSTTLTYSTGSDAGSGVASAHLEQRRAALSEGICQTFTSWQVRNNSISLSSGNSQYTVQDMQSGYCYQFGLRVTDVAGNNRFVTSGVSQNLSIDTTPPAAVQIDNTPSVITSQDLTFTWSESNDTESGIDRYECALGTSSGGSQAVAWNNCSATPTVTFSELDLNDGTIYYFSVRAVNTFGLKSSVSTSYAMLYFDVTIPNALNVTQVGEDTSAPWFDDNLSNDWTLITLQGEENMNCVWSEHDVGYTTGVSYVNACVQLSSGTYGCNFTSINEGSYNVSVACQDVNGNAQTAALNTDVSFEKEYSAPIINFNDPSGSIYSPSLLTFNITVRDVSDYVAVYNITDALTKNTIQHGTLVNDLLDLDATSLSGEYTINVTAVDSYGQSRSNSTNFIVAGGSPLAVLKHNITNKQLNNITYLNTNTTYEGTFYFTENISVTLSNASDSYELVQQTLTNVTDIVQENITINASNLMQGEYTLSIQSVGATTTLQENHTIVIDRTLPFIDVTANNITTPLNESISQVPVYIVVEEETTDIQLNYSIGQSNYTLVAQPTNPRPWRPNESRYVAVLPGYELVANTTLNYTWIVTDKAGNVNKTPLLSIPIQNQQVSIDDVTLPTALAGKSYYATIPFTDNDDSQTNFTCNINGLAGASISHIEGSKNCLIDLSSPIMGVHTIEVEVNDNNYDNIALSTATQILNLVVVENTTKDITADTDVFEFEVDIESSTDYVIPKQSLKTTTLLLPNSTRYNYTFNRSDTIIQAINAPRENITLFFRKNDTQISFASDKLQSADQYMPLRSHAVSVKHEENVAEEYSVGFYYPAFGYNDTSASDLRIFKYAYNETSEKILYTHPDSVGLLPTQLNTTTKTVSVNVENFSAFVLAQQMPTCFDDIKNQNEQGIDCGGLCQASCPAPPSNSGGSGGGSGGSSGGSFGGGFSAPKRAEPTCSDGVQNQNEIRVDCGGVCGPCQGFATCSDGLQNQDETGIDCGGSCQACAVAEPITVSCFDSIQNQGEQGVDCGGPCAACQQEVEPDIQQPQVQNPQPTQKQQSPYLYALVGFVLIGGLVVIAIEAPKKKNKDVLEAEKQPDSKNIIHIMQRMHRMDERDPKKLRSALLQEGFLVSYVDRALHVLDHKEKIHSITAYFEKYSREGYSLPHMVDWLASQGLEHDMLAVAVAQYKHHESY